MFLWLSTLRNSCSPTVPGIGEYRVMIVLAVLFAGLSALGALVGLDKIGHPVDGQLIDSYGWALCINAAAIAAYLVFGRLAGDGRDASRHTPTARHPPRASTPGHGRLPAATPR